VRLFVALEISAEVRENISQLICELKPLDDSWKYTRAENLHVTLKFLGETATEDLEKIVAALKEVPFERALALHFRSLGFFPNERRPRVLWVGIDAPADLPRLAQDIKNTLGSVQVPQEERAFTPHLTLARNRDGRLASKLRESLATFSGRGFGTVAVSAFHLIRSELKSTGAEYTTLASFPCRKNAT